MQEKHLLRMAFMSPGFHTVGLSTGLEAVGLVLYVSFIPPLVWAYQPNLKPFMWVFLLFLLSFIDTFVMVLANASSLCHTQVGSLSLISGRNGRNSWERGRAMERAAWETRAIWWRYGGVPGSGSALSTTHTAAGRPHSLVWSRPAPSGFSQAALSGCSLLYPITNSALMDPHRTLSKWETPSLSTAVALKYKSSKLHWRSLIHL